MRSMRVARVYQGKGLSIEIEYPSSVTAQRESMSLVQESFIATAAGRAWRVEGPDPYDRWQTFGLRLFDAHPPFSSSSSACFTSAPLDIRVRCYNADGCLAARQIRDSVTFESGTL